MVNATKKASSSHHRYYTQPESDFEEYASSSKILPREETRLRIPGGPIVPTPSVTSEEDEVEDVKPIQKLRPSTKKAAKTPVTPAKPKKSTKTITGAPINVSTREFTLNKKPYKYNYFHTEDADPGCRIPDEPSPKLSELRTPRMGDVYCYIKYDKKMGVVKNWANKFHCWFFDAEGHWHRVRGDGEIHPNNAAFPFMRLWLYPNGESVKFEPKWKRRLGLCQATYKEGASFRDNPYEMPHSFPPPRWSATPPPRNNKRSFGEMVNGEEDEEEEDTGRRSVEIQLEDDPKDDVPAYGVAGPSQWRTTRSPTARLSRASSLGVLLAPDSQAGSNSGSDAGNASNEDMSPAGGSFEAAQHLVHGDAAQGGRAGLEALTTMQIEVELLPEPEGSPCKKQKTEHTSPVFKSRIPLYKTRRHPVQSEPMEMDLDYEERAGWWDAWLLWFRDRLWI